MPKETPTPYAVQVQRRLEPIDKPPLVRNTNAFFGSIAFAPNGTLFMSSTNLDFGTGQVTDPQLHTVDATTGTTLTAEPTTDFFGALGIRPSDAVIFGGTGDQHQLFTMHAITGAETPIDDTGGTSSATFPFAS